MRRRISVQAALTALATTVAATTVAAAGLAAAGLGASPAFASGNTPMPAHVFAPYYEAYDTSGGGPYALSQASGAKYVSMAFLQTASAGSCTAYWNGDTSTPIAQSSFGS